MQNATGLDGMSSETTSRDIPMDLNVSDAAVVMAFKLIFIPCILIINGFVLVVYSKFPKLHAQPHNVFIIALAITDFATGLMTIPMDVFNHTSGYFVDPNTPMPWYYRSKALCLFGYFSILQPLQWSATTLVIIAIDRLIATFYPLKYYAVMTRARATTAVAIGWTVSSIPLYTTLAITDLETYTPQKLCRSGDQFPRVLENVITYVWSAIPVGISVAIYIAIGIKLSRHAKQVENQRQQTVMMAVVIVAFIVCLLPMAVVLQRPLTLSRRGFRIFINVAVELVYLNSCINPVIYNVFNTSFRKCSRELLCRGRNRASDITTVSDNGVQHTQVVDGDKL